MKKLTAIDPGKSGGIVTFDGQALVAVPMPQTDGDIIDYLRSIRVSGIDTVLMEDVIQFMPHVNAMAVLMRNAGFLTGVVQTLGFRLHLCRPQKWQKEFSLGSRKDHPGAAWKNHLRSHAQRLYPNVELTLKTADALLLFEYAQRTL